MKFLKAFSGLGLVAVLATAVTSGGTATAAPRGLVANLKDGAGNAIGTVRFIPTDDGAVSVRIIASGLAPGFHGYHVHSAGTCDPAAKDTAGNTVPFFSAGGHLNLDTTATHGAHTGDMPPLLATSDGAAFMKFKTDSFRIRDLMDADGSAVIVHAAADNLANIPGSTSTGAERYHSHVDDVAGPDTATKATGDAGARFGCGVVVKQTS